MGLFKYKKDWHDAPTVTTGLTRFMVANDLHIGSKYQDNPNALNEVSLLKKDGRTVLNGDIFDLACCPKKDVEKYTFLMEQFNKKFGFYYVHGNHERTDLVSAPMVLLTDTMLKVGFAHGDLLSDPERWFHYRLKPKGANWFQLLMVDLFDDLDHIKAMRPIPEQFLKNAVECCKKNDLDVLVCGHFHVEKERRYYIEGKVIIVLPAHRINEVWI